MSSNTPSHNLWNKALDTLSVELRNSLDLTNASHCNVLSKALKEAQEKRLVCAQKFWRVKKRNGETIILRDVVEKIIFWVEKFITVGDTAVQFDPTHAAPAWAAFRFVLQMAVNDKKAFGEMVENLEAVSHLIARYAILEELYLQHNSAARDKLEDMVVILYTEILAFLARAKKYFQSSARDRVAMSIFKVSEDEQMTKIKLLDGQIARLTEVFTIDVQVDTAKGVASMKALLTSLSEPIKRLLDQSSISAQILQESQHIQLLHWLSPVPFSSHHKRHSETRIPGSGQWLLNHDRYLDWRDTSSSSIFWLHGIIGSGKTSLASAVVDSFLQESSGQSSPAPIAYFYCTRNSAETERSNPDEILRSILRQLTVSHRSASTVHERILQEYERRQAVAKVDGFEMTRLEATECVKLILDTTAANPATIVLDAVDEIQPNSRHVLLSAFIQIVKDSLSVVKVFVTSRDDSNIEALLSDALAVRIQNEHIQKDMNEFVHREVSSAIEDRRMLNGSVSDRLKQSLMSVLISGAKEMFIWVVRQLDNLCRLKTEADIKTAMLALPKHTLNELYEQDFARISESGQYSRSCAEKVFSLLLCSQEPLSPEAVTQSILKTVSKEGETMTLAKMIDICANLAVLDSELNVLRFAHISFQEFLETKAEFAPNYVHSVAATSCLDLCLKGLPSGMDTSLSPKDNFYHYSAVYWAEHCRMTIVNGADDLIVSKMTQFVFDGGDVALSFIDWIQEVKNFTRKLPNDHAMAKKLDSVVHSGGSPLFTASVFGLASIINELAHAKDYDWNQTNDLGQSGLYLAAAAGHRTIVQSFLQHDVHVNVIGGKFGRPLHAACFGGQASIVELLLDHGADPKLDPRSALECAVLADHENIALFLLDGKFDVTDQTEYDSILQQAAEAGFADAVRFLQKNYASLYGETGSSRCRAVEIAIFRGRTGVVERHMQKSSDPNFDMPRGAIASAALGGQNAMINLLVEQGLDLNQEGVLGTPLRAASIMGHESTVRLLLEHGANLHVSGSSGEPLQAAAMRGHDSITRTLLNHGADVNSMGGLYGTALQAAAHRGHQRVVEILLDAGADVHRDGFSRDAFHAASEGGHEGIVRLLLERGFKFQKPLPRVQYRMGTPRLNVLREVSPSRLQETGSTWDHQPESKDWRERASVMDLSFVIEKMRGAVIPEPELIQPYFERLGNRNHEENYGLRAAAPIQPYLERLENQNHEENYALRAAAARGHITVVKLLLSHLDKMDIAKSEIFAAFIEACRNGHGEVVDELLSTRLEVRDLKTAIEAAALNGHLKVVNLLIDHEAKFGLARVETLRNERLATKDLNINIDLAITSPTQDTYECDSIARTVLNSGSKGGHLPILRRGQELVAQRCTDVASRHLYGEALTTAATKSNIGVIEALLKSNSEFDLEELTKTLNSVCAWGSKESLRVVLKRDTKKVLGIQQYSNGLTQAARKNNRQIVMYWLEEHPEHQKLILDPEAVIDVSGNGFMDILPPLIQRIKPVDSFEKTLSQCLQVASRNGHKEVVGYLIREGADVNAFVEEAQHYGGLDDAKAFFEEVQRISGPDDDAVLEEALYISGRYIGGCNELLNFNSHHDRRGSTRKLSALQAALIGFKRFSPETRSEYQPESWTGADAISQQGSIEILLAKGADPNAADEYERYPLNIAAAYCPVEIAQRLILSGAHAEAATKEHGTALEAAVRRGKGGLPIIEVLLKACALKSSGGTDKAAALNEALSFLKTSGRHDSNYTTSIAEVLSIGPGAVVKVLLANLPEEKADDSKYGLLAQMACRAGDQQCVELLLQRGMDVNSSGQYYGTALQAASRVGNIEIVERILNSGADVNILQGVHGTALRAAALGGHEDLVRILIAHGADANLGYVDNGKSILELALESRNHTIFKNLLVAGADIGTHILAAVCERGDTHLVELLLASSVDVNASGAKETRPVRFPRLEPVRYDERPYKKATPLNAACAEGHLSVIRLLLESGADVEKTNDSSATPLLAAIRGNQESVIRLLINAGADVNHAVYVTPLTEAAEDCKLEIVKELLHAGAIIAGPLTKSNALARACKSRQHMVIELLLATLSGTEYEAQICGEAICEAIKCGDDETVCLLLDHGVSPSFNMLRQACSAGVLEVVRVLVGRGIDVNEDDGDDAPLLHVAASHSRPSIVHFLINRGANVAFRSTKYGSPLIAALEGSMASYLQRRWQPEPCQSLAKQLPLPVAFYDLFGIHQEKPGYKEFSECERIVQSLFDACAEMDTTIRSFGNALHLASYMGSEVIVRHLLKGMDDVNIFGGYFGSPLIAALKGDHPIIVELLLDRGIEVNYCSPEHGSALHYACAHGSKETIQSLLDHGADINAYDDKHGSALAAAVSNDAELIMSHKGARSEERDAIISLLLHHEPKVQIRECDLLAAASWRYESDIQHVMSLLLSHDQSVVVTEELIVKTIQNFDSLAASDETLSLLLRRDGGLGTTPAMLKATKNIHILEMLLRHEPVCQVTADILVSAAEQHITLVNLLLKHDSKAPVTEATIMTAVRRTHYIDFGGPLLNFLLDQNREIKITDEMLEAAEAADILEVLLQRRSKEQAISSKILEEAAKRELTCLRLVPQLLKYDTSVKITPPVVHAAFASIDAASFMRTLLEHDPSLEITPQNLVWLLMFRPDWWWLNDGRKLISVLVEYGKTVEFTAEVRRRLSENFRRNKEMRELFYRPER